MTATVAQSWVGIVGALLTAALGLTKYFSYRSKRDRQTDVGTFFANTIDALASDNETKRMAAAVLLRRFFDRDTEQGASGRPYAREAVRVIAALLREEQPANLQKILADGLRYARHLDGVDLQGCDLHNAYLGDKKGDKIKLTLSGADLFKARCGGASFKKVIAVGTVFYDACLEGAVFTDADLRDADFRDAQLSGAKFHGAKIGGADFTGAADIPSEVHDLLGEDGKVPPNAVVPAEDRR